MTNLKQNQKGITNFITSTQGEDKLANEAIPAFINDYKNNELVKVFADQCNVSIKKLK